MSDQNAKMKLLQARVRPRLHTLLRIEAAKRGVSVRVLVESILAKHLKEEEVSNG